MQTRDKRVQFAQHVRFPGDEHEMARGRQIDQSRAGDAALEVVHPSIQV
jgi:hypothetical protein